MARVTQLRIEEIIELRALVWALKHRPEEMGREMAADAVRQYEQELRVNVRKLTGMLRAGAQVERGEYRLEDALPEERQLKLPL
jgi:hypothetical protein